MIKKISDTHQCIRYFFGAAGRGRTVTVSLPPDFESGVCQKLSNGLQMAYLCELSTFLKESYPRYVFERILCMKNVIIIQDLCNIIANELRQIPPPDGCSDEYWQGYADALQNVLKVMRKISI